MAYSDKVIDHYENPRNVGVLDKDDAHVGTGMVGAPACGDVMRLQIRSAMTASSRMRVSRPTAAAPPSPPARWSRNG
jgi:NifU-like protein involved in Fe-S cluster formation